MLGVVSSAEQAGLVLVELENAFVFAERIAGFGTVKKLRQFYAVLECDGPDGFGNLRLVAFALQWVEDKPLLREPCFGVGNMRAHQREARTLDPYGHKIFVRLARGVFERLPQVGGNRVAVSVF